MEFSVGLFNETDPEFVGEGEPLARLSVGVEDFSGFETGQTVVDDHIDPLLVLVETQDINAVLVEDSEHRRVDALTHILDLFVVQSLGRIVKTIDQVIMGGHDRESAHKPAVAQIARLYDIIATGSITIIKAGFILLFICILLVYIVVLENLLGTQPHHRLHLGAARDHRVLVKVHRTQTERLLLRRTEFVITPLHLILHTLLHYLQTFLQAPHLTIEHVIINSTLKSKSVPIIIRTLHFIQ